MKDNIVLIGMPGVGKSTVGVILAKALGFEFIDSDLLIQNETHKLLHEIIESDGIDGFIKIEEDVNKKIKATHSVIATGGSVVYGAKAMEHFKEISTIVYLKLSYSELEKRIGDLHNRGVVLKEGMTFKDLYDERCVLYEKYADITVDEKDKSIGETMKAVLNALKV